ncbi:hypothetical protein ACFL35_04575 [Candidatus Riflebacteria bacterium]
MNFLKAIFILFLFLFLTRIEAAHILVVTDEPFCDLYVNSIFIAPLPGVLFHVEAGDYKFSVFNRKNGSITARMVTILPGERRIQEVRLPSHADSEEFYYPPRDSYEGAIWLRFIGDENVAFLEFRDIDPFESFRFYYNHKHFLIDKDLQSYPFIIPAGRHVIRFDETTSTGIGAFEKTRRETADSNPIAYNFRAMGLGLANLGQMVSFLVPENDREKYGDTFLQTGNPIIFNKHDVLSIPEVDFIDRLKARMEKNKKLLISDPRKKITVKFLLPDKKGRLKLKPRYFDLILNEKSYARVASKEMLKVEGRAYQKYEFSELVRTPVKNLAMQFNLNRRGKNFSLYMDFKLKPEEIEQAEDFTLLIKQTRRWLDYRMSLQKLVDGKVIETLKTLPSKKFY